MKEALKLALQWAETHGLAVFAGGGMKALDSMSAWAQAVSSALAELEQEPATWGYRSKDGAIYDCISPEAHADCEGEYTVPLYAAPPKQEPHNFCPRCGKRTADLTTIHTCTPPRELEMT